MRSVILSLKKERNALKSQLKAAKNGGAASELVALLQRQIIRTTIAYQRLNTKRSPSHYISDAKVGSRSEPKGPT